MPDETLDVEAGLGLDDGVILVSRGSKMRSRSIQVLLAAFVTTIFIGLPAATSTVFAQESVKDDAAAVSAVEKEKQNSGFELLKQFAGTWAAVSKATASDVTHKATMKSRVVGETWIVNEHSGQFGKTKFEAVQTIGYDSRKKEYTGTWIDSMNSYRWKYSGQFDGSGKKLTLNAKGPDWNDPSKTKDYRDIYEFKTEKEIAGVSQMMNDQGKWETFMTSTITKTSGANSSKTTVTPFLMFTGKAEEAIEHYKTIFPGTTVQSMEKYKAGEAGPAGTIKLATFVVAGQRIKCTDSPPIHDFDFTPSFSFFVQCENEDQLKERFEKLSAGGKVMMPVNDYGFSEKFGWTSDKFGVSWQLNLE